MERIYHKTDVYYAERRYPLDEDALGVLIYLYEPLMGSHAYSLYHFLNVEAMRMERFHHTCSFYRLLTNLSLSLQEFTEAIQNLEALGLMKTYKNETTYLFRLKYPLSSSRFFKHPILANFLKMKIGDDQYEISKNYFKISGEDIHKYQEITTSFHDIFGFKNHYLEKEEHENFRERKNANVSYEYDMSLFYETITNYQIPRKKYEKELAFIQEMAYIFHIDSISLAKLVKDSIYHSENESKVFDKTYFKGLCEDFGRIEYEELKEVMKVQPIQERSPISESLEDKHIEHLETLSPYEYLKETLGGAKPPLHELNILEDLMLSLKLNPGVVNVLLDYVLKANKGELTRNFVGAIGASWKRKNVKTAKQAIELVRQSENRNFKKTYKKSVDEILEENHMIHKKDIKQDDITYDEEEANRLISMLESK